MSISTIPALSKLNIATWLEEVEKAAESIAANHEDTLETGLNTFQVTKSDAHLAILGVNRVAFPAAPVFPAGAAPTKAQVEAYEAQKEYRKDVYAGLATLKNKLLDTLPLHTKRALQLAQGTNGPGIPGHTVHDIMEYIHANFNVLNDADVAATMTAIKSLRAHGVSDFLEQATSVQQKFDQLHTARQPASEHTKLSTLTDMISTAPGLVEALRHYQLEVPILANRTLAAAIAHIEARAIDYTPTSGSLGYAGGAIGGSGITPVPHGGGRNQGGRGGRGAGRAQVGRGRGRGRNAQPIGGAPLPAAVPTVVRRYCFEHGFNWSHPGHTCKVMGVPSYNATPAMLAATAPATIDGYVGCTDVVP
jgi:hypothetical protein